MRIKLASGLFMLASAGMSAVADERWVAVILHPQGAKSSSAEAASGARQAGRIEIQNGQTSDYHPVLWNHKAQDYVDLLPPGWRAGQVYAMDADMQGGEVRITGNPHAALWRSDPESWVDLTPGGLYRFAAVYGVHGDQQVGYAGCDCDGNYHAMLWRGTSDSFVDLHPITARWSQATATDGEWQGGEASFPQPGQIHAVLWHGTADSFVDMHPAGAKESFILHMVESVQVGWGLFGSHEHGLIWRGTPESVVELLPSGAINARIYATTGAVHVGYVSYVGQAVAGYWSGDDSESFHNLEQYLPPEWSYSVAKSIAIADGRLFVAGAARSPKGIPSAVLWIGNVYDIDGGVNRPPKKELPIPPPQP